MREVHLAISKTLSAFDKEAIGSKVGNHDAFLAIVADAVSRHNLAKDRVSGQHVIDLPAEACQYVCAGIGLRRQNADSYVLRNHRGRVDAFLKRHWAAPVSSVTVIVYDRMAYLSDPDVSRDMDLYNHVSATEATHVVVAVLASTKEGRSPLTPYRLVHNLAGGNREAEQWSAGEICSKAKASKEYWDTWAVVAD